MNILKNRSILPVITLIAVIFSLFSCVDEEGGEKQSVKKEKISGFVQKDPFVRGTSILMNELDSELAQTGKVFTSQISNDQGLFVCIQNSRSIFYIVHRLGIVGFVLNLNLLIFNLLHDLFSLNLN